MKYFLSAFFIFFLFQNECFSYEVKWLKKNPQIDVQKEGIISLTNTYAFMVSDVLPLRKIVSISDVEIKKNKKDSTNFCDGNFFPADKLNFSQIQKHNFNGIHFVRGFWEEEFKYVVASCAKTKEGFKTSTAFIRLPFLSRALRETYLNQLGFLKDGALTENKKTVFKNILKELFYFSFFSKSYAQMGPIPGTGALTTSLNQTKASVDRLTDQIGESTRVFNQESDDWQKESRRWQKVTDKFIEESSHWRSESTNWRDEISKWRGESSEWRDESGKWRDEAGAMRKMLDKTLSPGNFFKVGLATAAGAAIGSFGMNAILDGVQLGVSKLVDFLNLKQRRELNGLEIERLKEALSSVNGNFNLLEQQIDRLVMSLPVVDFFSKFDKYEELETQVFNRLRQKQETLEITEGRNKRAFGELPADCDTCRDEFDFSNDLKLKKEIENIENFSTLLELKQKVDLNSYCKKIDELLNKWYEAELNVKEARVLLYGKKDRATFLEAPFKEFKSAAKAIRKAPIKAAEGIENRAKKALDKGEKAIISEFNKRFDQGAFKEEKTSCENNWCRGRGLSTPEDVSCSSLIIDLQKSRVDSSKRLIFPSGMHKIPLSSLGFEEKSIRDLSEGQKIDLLLRFEKLNRGICFRESFQKHYPEILESKIGCDGYEFMAVKDMKDLAQCSQDFLKMEAIYLEIVQDVDKVRGSRDGLEHNNVKSSAFTRKLIGLRRESKDLASGAESIAEDSNHKILEGYPHIDFVREFCPDIR